MKSISGKDFCKVLEKKGWLLKTIKGSHHVYMKSGKKVRISVPVHSNKDLKRGLLEFLVKIADIKENEL